MSPQHKLIFSWLLQVTSQSLDCVYVLECLGGCFMTFSLNESLTPTWKQILVIQLWHHYDGTGKPWQTTDFSPVERLSLFTKEAFLWSQRCVSFFSDLHFIELAEVSVRLRRVSPKRAILLLQVSRWPLSKLFHILTMIFSTTHTVL